MSFLLDRVNTPLEWLIYAIAVGESDLLEEAEGFCGAMLVEDREAMWRARSFLEREMHRLRVKEFDVARLTRADGSVSFSRIVVARDGTVSYEPPLVLHNGDSVSFPPITLTQE